MGRHNKDLTGTVKDRLTVIRSLGSQDNRRIWLCKCSCGKEDLVLNTKQIHLNSSCGCLRIDNMTTHGMTHTRVNAIWRGIKGRCFGAHHSYERYGAKGITMAPEWVDDFQAFYDYVGEPPSNKHSIDRYPNGNGNYEPGNVRWATAHEQTANRDITILDWNKVKELRQLYSEGVTDKELSLKYAMSLKNTRSVILNQKWIDPDYTPPAPLKQRLSRETANEIRNSAEQGDSFESIQEAFGITRRKLMDILTNRNHYDPEYIPYMNKTA